MFYNHLPIYISQGSYLQETKVDWLKLAENEFIKRILSCSQTLLEDWRIRARAPWPKYSKIKSDITELETIDIAIVTHAIHH